MDGSPGYGYQPPPGPGPDGSAPGDTPSNAGYQARDVFGGGTAIGLLSSSDDEADEQYGSQNDDAMDGDYTAMVAVEDEGHYQVPEYETR